MSCFDLTHAPVATAARAAATGPVSMSKKGKGDAVRIEPAPPSPRTCRFGAHSSRTRFRPQARGDGTRIPSVLEKSRALCRVSIWARSNSGSQEQQHRNKSIPVYELPARRRRQLLTRWFTSTASSLPDAVVRLPG